MFETIRPEQAGISSLEVKRYIDFLNDNSYPIHALLLLRDGKIFTEAYWAPFHRDLCHRQYSQTKSFVSMAIGLLVEEGKLSLDDKIADLFSEKIDDTASVPPYLMQQSVRQMLTMTTVGDGRWWLSESDPDRTHLYLNGRTEAKLPGALWEYDSSGSQVLSSLVEKISGMPLFDFLSDRVFRHMGTFQTAYMLKTPNGDTWGDSAMLCTARDMASFAQLLLQGGRWGERQLIPEGYVKEATSAIVDNSEQKHAQVFGHGYGYQIFCAPRGGFALVGMGGQLSVVIPEHKLILIINADTQGIPAAYDVIVNGFLSHIADRLSPTPLPCSDSDYDALQTTVRSLTLFALQGKRHSTLPARIDNKTFLCESNPLGMTRFTFRFHKNGGELCYTNAQGDKILPFGIHHNVFGSFPELGYSDAVGREVTTNGHTYADAVSLRFTEENKLQLKVQIIDKYLGNLLATFAFVNDVAECQFTASAENFLKEYHGRVRARLCPESE